MFSLFVTCQKPHSVCINSIQPYFMVTLGIIVSL